MTLAELLFLPLVPFLALTPWLLRRRTVLEPALLSPPAARSLAVCRQALEQRLEWADEACQRVREARRRQDPEALSKLRGSALALVAALVEDVGGDLASWRGQAHGLAAALAPEPQRVRDLRLPRLKLWAVRTVIVQALLVSAVERLRWQCRATASGLALVRAAAADAPGTADPDQAVRRLDAVRHDLRLLIGAALATYTALLLSLQSQRRESNAAG